MAVKWTDDQRRVIESRNRNLLVSAAAGSGKTAVLVERIVEMVMDGERPVDIDRLLVMTFTNAAAAEMRERVQAAIEKRRQAEPENARLELQSVLVPRAQITTIDSFCLGLVQEYYNHLDLDPSFRIGDEGELSLLQGDVMRELLEDWYAKGDDGFLRFVETYALGKSDFGIEEVIFQVHDFSQSHPWPKEWLEECRRELSEDTLEGVENSRWMAFLMEDVRLQAAELAEQLREAAALCLEEDGPAPYYETLLEDVSLLERFGKGRDYQAFFELLGAAGFGRLPQARGADLDPGKKARVAACRDRVKKAVKKWQENFGSQPPEEILEALSGTRETTMLLLDLAEEYGNRYQEAKRERDLVDFHDLEHFALEILWEKQEGGEWKPSPVADELSERYEEILVDEYQDSNLVQETMIQALSRERFGRPNVFMVGDVKQSIYRFRLARPELFLKKYETYTLEESAYQKIELRRNFRSRDKVLAAVNQVFYQIMTKGLGGIRYTEDMALYPGASYAAPKPGQEDRVGTPAELWVAPVDAKALEAMDEDAADYTVRELEARIAAERIREMTDPEKGLLIWDPEREEYRTVRYGDIVILLRSMSGWAETFVTTLMNAGMPATAQTQTGYFDTVEVETVLSLLAIVDNPFQDIPMAAVLRSPIVGMTDEELAWLMAEFKKRPDKTGDRGIYGALRLWLYGKEPAPEGLVQEEEGQFSFRFEDFLAVEPKEPPARERYPEITGKLEKLEALLGELRFLATYLPVSELVYQAYRISGYYDYVSAMPAGQTRKANLDMLAEKAAAYENTSYKGLFHFIRYVEGLKKYETDFGEAQAAGDMAETVRIMSVHKSKGLEFPVVILAGMGKRFNKQDMIGKILIDPDLGIAADCLDLERRVKRPTLKKEALKRRMDLETLGEELRVLYVAMTRAKEKLILTGTDKSLEKKLEKWGIQEGTEEVCLSETEGPVMAQPLGGLPFTVLSGGASYLDWIFMALPAMEGTGSIRFHIVSLQELVGKEVREQMERQGQKEELLSTDWDQTFDEKVKERLDSSLSYQYPYRPDMTLYAMLSVSEIKRRRQAAERGDEGALEAAGLFEKGAFGAKGGSAKVSGGDGTSGAERGSAVHRVLQLLDLGRYGNETLGLGEIRAMVEAEVAAMEASGRLLSEDAAMVDPGMIAGFLAGPVGRRMARAFLEGRLYREQQFMVGIPAREMKVADSDELVLVQGIIDAWMEEGDGLVLIDYKTDAVGPGGERYLAARYRIQLDYYARSLEQMTGKRVKERILYSLVLQKALKI